MFISFRATPSEPYLFFNIHSLITVAYPYPVRMDIVPAFLHSFNSPPQPTQKPFPSRSHTRRFGARNLYLPHQSFSQVTKKKNEGTTTHMFLSTSGGRPKGRAQSVLAAFRFRCSTFELSNKNRVDLSNSRRRRPCCSWPPFARGVSVNSSIHCPELLMSFAGRTLNGCDIGSSKITRGCAFPASVFLPSRVPMPPILIAVPAGTQSSHH